MKNNNICKFVTEKISGGLTIKNFVYEKDNTQSDVSIIKKNHMVCLVTSGEGCLITEASEIPLKPGVLFFTFAGSMHRIHSISDLQYMYITFSGSRSEELFERFGISQDNCFFNDFKGLISFWENSLGNADECNLDLISESVLLYTISRLSAPEQNHETELCSRIVSYVENRFTYKNMSLSYVAGMFGYSSKYISRLFSQNMGMTFSKYLKNTRIKHAIFLMEQGLTSVKNIAILSGYNSPLYFSKLFRETVGMTPGEYITRNCKK